MFRSEESPLGIEIFYFYRDEKVCSIRKRNGAWFFLVPGRGWQGETCGSKEEAESKAIVYIKSLKNKVIDSILFDTEVRSFEKEVKVVQSGKDLGIL